MSAKSTKRAAVLLVVITYNQVLLRKVHPRVTIRGSPSYPSKTQWAPAPEDSAIGWSGLQLTPIETNP